MAAVPPPDSTPASGSSRSTGTSRAGEPVGARWPAGPVTGIGRTQPPAGPGRPPPVGPGGPPPAPGQAPTPPGTPPGPPGRGRTLWWFGGVAGSILLVGLVLVLVHTSSGGPSPGTVRRPGGDSRPPLARACPPPTAAATAAPPGPAGPGTAGPGPAGPAPVPTGPRTVDTDSGISYAAFPAPWEPWRTVWRAGTLQVSYRVGQHFVTESGYDGSSDYHASILSGSVPAADNDALALDLECVGRQVAADVRASYYPQPNSAELIRDERRSLGGLPAWVTVFRLHFVRAGLRARDELAAVACIDVGRPTAAILYVSIPGTHRQYDWVVEAALASVRPA
ncbi:hypothetical protein [Plantactinospora sp. KBS50]|uniref:hypothetical protein n=1 Tax=Plantactinospora sp. KBS50 TaxID=2024580 RepID=UPI000BAB0B00|nr:hypothetical protein [Plantactinospora sp. KBS50]ASW56636.1 hypothetical protein CIK06_24450 [Plantactinospora sp. KBS50]